MALPFQKEVQIAIALGGVFFDMFYLGKRETGFAFYMYTSVLIEIIVCDKRVKTNISWLAKPLPLLWLIWLMLMIFSALQKYGFFQSW